jgi:hypothetical protein
MRVSSSESVNYRISYNYQTITMRCQAIPTANVRRFLHIFAPSFPMEPFFMQVLNVKRTLKSIKFMQVFFFN